MNKTALGLAFIALSCPSMVRATPGNQKPDWIDGSSMEYPREKYLLGVGLGDDRATAEDRARGEISKIFSTQVSVHTSLAESETNLKTDNKNESTFSQGISQSVQTASKKIIEDVALVEHWQDAATRQHYALAVLDRAKAQSAVKDKIAEFDKQAEQWKGQMEGSTEKLARVKSAMKLLALLKARSNLNAELRVLDPEGRGIASPIGDASVQAQAAKAVSELDVVVDVNEL